jgi:hypothetical protein
MRISRTGFFGAFAAGFLIALAWVFWPEADERAIKRRLNQLVAEVNASGGEGLALVTRATQLGSYFTTDVVVDLGSESGSPINGRETLAGLAARFQPAAHGAVVGLEDVAVATRKGTDLADVALTVTLTDVDARSGERTRDAREFALEMRKESGEWLIARATAVDLPK